MFLLVLIPQLAFVAVAGTDIPFHDQWNVEGQWLYPKWADGTLTAGAVLQPLNEHRIAWTHGLNLSLFVLNGQWDPLVQLAAIALLRAACAAGLAWVVAADLGRTMRFVALAAVVTGFLPHLAWHSVLWGIESQVYFALGFSLLALGLLSAEPLRGARLVGGPAAAIAGLFAMGPAALVPAALLGLAGLRALERRRIDRAITRTAGIAAGLFVLALVLRVEVPEHASLRARSVGEFVGSAARVLGWPHVGMSAAALVLNLPVLLLVVQRLRRRRLARAGEDFILTVAGWSAAIGLATAWVRGGGAELLHGVPSRYVDFIVLLPLANLWCLVVLVHEAALQRRSVTRLVASAWVVFLLVGWLGLSAEVTRGIALPRARDRAAPVRLMRAFQASGDAAVFAGQPRLLVPHPNPESVRAVLDDPRLRGRLPPSLQPDSRPGPLSRATRAVLGQ